MARLGDERLPDATTGLAPDRDILQIRVVGAEPPGLRTSQAIASVNPARRRVDLILQGIGVG